MNAAAGLKNNLSNRKKTSMAIHAILVVGAASSRDYSMLAFLSRLEAASTSNRSILA